MTVWPEWFTVFAVSSYFGETCTETQGSHFRECIASDAVLALKPTSFDEQDLAGPLNASFRFISVILNQKVLT
jgi:hypothetical protein